MSWHLWQFDVYCTMLVSDTVRMMRQFPPNTTPCNHTCLHVDLHVLGTVLSFDRLIDSREQVCGVG